MLGLDHHADALGFKVLGEPIAYLDGEALLDLQTAGELLDDPGELAQPEDAVAGQVGQIGPRS